ncbi:murein DD-endopeptidase MepM/ murein hydrolase activator NlpD [Roseibium hamelinense]|uniref:Murein DD-endopeptidase MepM/ murein hydrolase activator NlpD n=1 Tax=Roseibium hamelinense TaxID=150831 RepID=A0A562SEV0_9HYPH|nr:M23 family metallopeptidase [Roseibium hamelinense]MTI42846.1 M23 family metallopeptidase [Roseibium hamelinense]TWI79877.1 murein DD-endopeptidase MepM/ murein hydrolase activator NlpD [Roseibium hamelinense]
MHFAPFKNSHTFAVDLGEHPPLIAGEDKSLLHDRKSVSIRWLTGTILTGVTSLVLMGGALFSALDGQYSVSAATGFGSDRVAGDAGRGTLPGSKGDRMIKTAAEFANKQVVPVNVVTRDGDKEHIRVKPYALVTSSLATRKETELAQQIPAFNPLNMFSENQDVPERNPSNASFSDSIYGAKVEGEVSITLARFPANSGDIDFEETPSEAEVELSVRETARFMTDQAENPTVSALFDPGRFDFNLARQPELQRYAVRITPENVSFVSKRDEDIRFAGMDEKIVPLTEDMDLFDVMRDNDATEQEAELIQSAFDLLYNVTSLSDGQRLRIAYAPVADGSGRMRPERVSLYSDTVHRATIAKSDTGAYIKANAPTTFLADAFAEADRISYGGPTPALYDSIYQTALEQDLSEPLIDELIRIFSFDVDFNSRVQPGDSLEVFFAEENISDGPPEVLYAALNTGNSERRFYRFRTPDDGVVDYYDSNGQSAKKFLMRKPLSSGRFRSGFGMRRHPIHKYKKMHTGVDWAAPRGTPIMAAGNATVVKAGWSSGYGRRIELRHANGYTTTYSHMTGFAKGVREGTKVSQGQIVGYVGSTGLSTGPHLHYEVLVNGRFVDPMRIRLPRGRVLDGDMLTAFETERQRIDALLDRARPPSRVASAQ